MYKLIGNDGVEYGPASAETIREWIALGRCDASTRAAPAGTAEWQPLGSWPEFAPQFAPRGPLPGDRLALASIICGAVGVVLCVPAPVGLVLGLMARRRLTAAHAPARKRQLATAGIIVSAAAMLLTLLCSPILAGLFLPALAKAKQRAQSVQCSNNLKELSLALLAQAGENANQLPPVTTWCDAISPRLGSPKIFHCPAGPNGTCGYAINERLRGGIVGRMNAKTVLLFESDAGWNAAGGEKTMVSRGHSTSRLNTQSTSGREAIFYVTFVDGTFAAIPESGLVALRWDP